MNLRNAENYSIGLDLGTNSVGWAVVDENGQLYHIKGHPSWGSRLFSEAESAKGTRLKRSQRRRYDRRRQRLDCLQSFFVDEMSKVDPEFFIRLRQSRLLKSDRSEAYDTGYRWPLFNSKDFTERDYYSKFRTIYHLRAHLMASSEKEDIRLVYLALHNIVKYRGNFLYEDEGTTLKASNANSAIAAHKLKAVLNDYASEWSEYQNEDVELVLDPSEDEICQALDARNLRRDERAEKIQDALHPARDRASKNYAKLIAKACLGYKVEFSSLVAGVQKQEGTNFSVGSEDSVESFMSETCPEAALPLVESIERAYSSYILSEMLDGKSSISAAKIASYDRHRNDLDTLKSLFRTYLSKDEYNNFFRGPKNSQGEYNINRLPKNNYTAFVLGDKLANGKGCTHEKLLHNIRSLCESSDALQKDSRFLSIKERLYAPDSDFLLKQKTRDNGAIPYQLHLEEMDAIINAQGKFYPFLLEHKKEMEKLVSSRIPYYVGPLNAGHDPANQYPNNPVDRTRKFGWSVRKTGMEHAKAHPWNVAEVIDTDETATRFIQRMTGTCTYLYGEPVLPRHSLLYEEFCALNELNGARWGEVGMKSHRFDHADCQRIVEELFKKRSFVSYAAIQVWLRNNHGIADPRVSGAQAEKGFESKLTSYRYFCKLFNVNHLEEAPLSYEQLEEIILWSTVFEDRSILRRKLGQKYGIANGGPLSDEQIKRIASNRFSGWGRLSRKLLTGIRVAAPVAEQTVSIMDVLRDGNPYRHLRTTNFMEAITDSDLGFQASIEQLNDRYFANGNELTVDDLQGSPQNRRSVNQAMLILDELIGITGKAPSRICIEVTRDDDLKKRGKRSRTRYDQLSAALRAFNESNPKLLSDLEARKQRLDDDRLMLYFAQCGKCMYSGDPLDINQLSNYQIDHILPQSYIKDDSLSNRVLVKSGYNQRKLDSLLLNDTIINRQLNWWKQLLRVGLISEKKFHNLTRREVSDGELKGFVNRQLVETSQITKFVRQMCEQKYPFTEVISVKASISHGLRDNLNLPKCRELNHYHHAHDAFLACQAADYIARRYPRWQEGISLKYIRSYLKKKARDYVPGKNLPGRSGLIVDSFTLDYVDQDTSELVWDSKSRCEYIRHALDYKDCFISRMPEDQTGAFWDETIYSPRDKKMGKSLSVPLKSSGRPSNYEGRLDPKKYGGVSSVKQAYWLIFAAIDNRGRKKYFFEGVPIYKAASIHDRNSLQTYAESIAIDNGCHDAVVLRSHIRLRQKLELDGQSYYLFGNSDNSNELRPASEMIACGKTLQDIIMLQQNDGRLNDEQLIKLFDYFSGFLDKTSTRLAKLMGLQAKRAAFLQCSKEDKTTVLKALLSKINQTSQKIDLSPIGGGEKAAFLRVSIAKNLQSIVWIDQSVTGIFEARTTFEDLTHEL